VNATALPSVDATLARASRAPLRRHAAGAIGVRARNAASTLGGWLPGALATLRAARTLISCACARVNVSRVRLLQTRTYWYGQRHRQTYGFMRAVPPRVAAAAHTLPPAASRTLVSPPIASFAPYRAGMRVSPAHATSCLSCLSLPQHMVASRQTVAIGWSPGTVTLTTAKRTGEDFHALPCPQSTHPAISLPSPRAPPPTSLHANWAAACPASSTT